MDIEFLFLILIFITTDIFCVKIIELDVPEIASPSSLPIILDCDYSLEFPKDEGLVVKWFFNERLYPIYQWIPEAKPQELGILKGRLDLSHRASEDRHKMHRALKIVELSPEMAGNYTCSVSTFSSEDKRTKMMSVFVPEKSLELQYPLQRVEEAASKILCQAKEVYPKPQLRLYLNNSEVENTITKFQQKPSGLFDMEVSIITDTIMDGMAIACELQLPSLNYTVKKEAVYYEGWSSTISTGSSNVFTLFYIYLSVTYVLFNLDFL